ncbi:hypothetical protein Taro_035137 [Colocasia esculenta]|uniref:Uncharacterized protein n=1 Tax=Colocasia esculenta TaxID=4460 RepID=A0A843VTH4_COLES|nr:hypothetical protein [Colocasia esculenta]
MNLALEDREGCSGPEQDKCLRRFKELPDGTEQWIDVESKSRYLSATSLDSESRSILISAEEAFVSVMRKDQSGRIHCGGSRETHRTWYGREGSSSSDYQ